MRLRENWYRDVWLFVITVLSMATLIVGLTQNSARIADQQRSRADGIRIACDDLNRTHDETLLTIDRVTVKRLLGGPLLSATTPRWIVEAKLRNALLKASPALRTATRQGLQFTTLIVDALAPVRDCDQRVARFTR